VPWTKFARCRMSVANSAAAGCNSGNISMALITVMATITRSVTKIAGQVRRLTSQVARAIAETRIHRARLEAELYRNRFRLRSNSDDDLPIIR